MFPLLPAQSHPQTQREHPVSLENTSLPTFPLISAGFALLCVLIMAGLWVGRLQEKITRGEEDRDDLRETLEKIQETLKQINAQMDADHRLLRKEILEEIKKEIVRSEGNIDNAFQAPFLRLNLQMENVVKMLNARDNTINQLKSAVTRIGADAREAKAIARMGWEIHCGGENGPPSKPQRYS